VDEAVPALREVDQVLADGGVTRDDDGAVGGVEPVPEGRGRRMVIDQSRVDPDVSVHPDLERSGQAWRFPVGVHRPRAAVVEFVDLEQVVGVGEAGVSGPVVEILCERPAAGERSLRRSLEWVVPG
jgi:hypothetical protein